MRKLLNLFGWAALLMAVLTVPTGLAAQQVAVAVEGKFLFYDGKPMAGVSIVFKLGDDVKAQAVTDAEGFYRVEELPFRVGDRLVVEIKVGDKTLFSMRDFNPRTGDVTKLNINLAKEAKSQGRTFTPEQAQEMREGLAGQKSHKAMEKRFKDGLDFLEAGEFAQAITELEAAALMDDTQPAIFGNLARAYASAGQHDKGIETYQKAIELKPNEGALYNNMGQLYLKVGNNKEAMAAFKMAAENDPENAGMFYYNLGVTLYNADQLGDAVEPFRLATVADPKRANAYYFLGMCLINQMGFTADGSILLKPGTREALQKYLELKPKGEYATQAKESLAFIANDAEEGSEE